MPSKTHAITGHEANCLAQRLSAAPLGRSASVAAAAERFERLLAAKIGAERAQKAINAILTVQGFETAEGRLVAEIDACEAAAAPPAAPAHARFRAKLAALVELVGNADATGLRTIPINPVSSNPKALARYRDLAVLAIEDRVARA